MAKIRWTDIVSVAVVVLAIVAALLQVNAWLVALSIVVAVIARYVSSEQERKRARAQHIKLQLDELYGPWAQVAKARLQSEADYGNFREHMTYQLSEVHGHLAEPATKAAFLRIDREGKWGGPEDLELARAFLADHDRIVEEYQRLAGTA